MILVLATVAVLVVVILASFASFAFGTAALGTAALGAAALGTAALGTAALGTAAFAAFSGRREAPKQGPYQLRPGMTPRARPADSDPIWPQLFSGSARLWPTPPPYQFGVSFVEAYIEAKMHRTGRYLNNYVKYG
jgi:hypothetical protein